MEKIKKYVVIDTYNEGKEASISYFNVALAIQEAARLNRLENDTERFDVKPLEL